MKPCHHIRKNDRLIVMTLNVLIVIGTKKLFSDMIHYLRMSSTDFHVVFFPLLAFRMQQQLRFMRAIAICSNSGCIRRIWV